MFVFTHLSHLLISFRIQADRISSLHSSNENKTIFTYCQLTENITTHIITSH